ncbi:proton-conducting transporter membrane subunit [Athalassotoga sp.]|uniref:proton-conducting transporter transmembrane domain-containing protein n=1 Tax=Athalassotoga sp. TaxID=2022597 RepID=UPI003D0628CD
MSMIFAYISFTLYILGILFSFKREASYLLSFLGSIFVFVTGIIGTFYPFTLGEIELLPKIYMSMDVNHLSGIFMTIAATSWIAISIYSVDYGKFYSKDMGLWLNLSMIGMLTIMMAKDGLTFITGWEVMTVSSYLLILKSKGSFKEAFEFLAFGELSTVALIIAFASIFLKNGNFSLVQNSGTALFLIAITFAFAVKMGIFPFHTWLIGAHVKAPSNVSALLSAPLTLMGVYGIFMALSVMPNLYLYNFEWWGILAVGFGAVSAFWGALQALAAKQLKTLPAYSTIENNGMILSAIGISVIAIGDPNLQILSAFATLTAIILTISHTFSKSLLFLSIGHAKEALNEENIDDLRGSWSAVGKIPALGIILSGLSFSAFPPLIGFVGEWMLLETFFQSYKLVNVGEKIVTTFSGIFVALAIGMAAFSMVKLTGYTALGFDHGKKSKNMPNMAMKIAEIFLITFVVAPGIFAPFVVKYLGYGIFTSGLFGVPKPFLIISSIPVFGVLSPTFFTIVFSILFIFPLFFYLSRRKKVRKIDPWNGGLSLKENEYFSAPAYSAILEIVLKKIYITKEKISDYEAHIEVVDVVNLFYKGLKSWILKIEKIISQILMNGNLNVYIIYILIAFTVIFFILR